MVLFFQNCFLSTTSTKKRYIQRDKIITVQEKKVGITDSKLNQCIRSPVKNKNWTSAQIFCSNNLLTYEQQCSFFLKKTPCSFSQAGRPAGLVHMSGNEAVSPKQLLMGKKKPISNQPTNTSPAARVKHDAFTFFPDVTMISQLACGQQARASAQVRRTLAPPLILGVSSQHEVFKT